MITAVVLHPDPNVRDPFGVITRSQVHEIHRIAQGFAAGFELGVGRKPLYHDVKRYVDSLVDIPDYLVSAIALHVTWQHPDPWSRQLPPEFTPIL